MKKLLLLFFTINVLSIVNSFCQTPSKRTCGSMDYLAAQKAADPLLESRMQAIEAHTKQYISNRNAYKPSASVITIPVVFHVVYKLAAENISDAQCIAQLNQLNLDYAKLNSDTNTVPAAFRPLAADTKIQFCLAQRDPSGNATTGIIHKSTTTTSFSSNDNVKKSSRGGDDPWDASQYLNIWSCNLGNSLLGYAQFPGGSAATDGVVLLYSAVGSMTTKGTASPYDLGRTATHEVGHWLNLRHIWGDATCGDDLVADTPPAKTSNFGCLTFPYKSTGCNVTANGEMFMNYMDYTDDACMQMFTAGQSTRMNAIFGTGGSRASLLTSLGCQPPAAASSFTFTPASDVNVTCGSAASPTTLLSNVVGTFTTPITLSYSASIGGSTVTFGTNPLTPGNSTTVTLNNANTLAPGTDTIIITGVAGAITQKDTILFVIQPGSAPVITTQPSNQTVCAGANATFTSASSTGGVSYQWQVSTNSGSSWSNVASGGTSASYTVNSTTTAQNNYQYRVIISTLCGTVTSNAATLTVNAAPAISVSPASVSVCAGSSHTFSSTATGTNLTYQWQVSTNSGTSWSNVASGGTSATYQLTGITIGQNGYQYHVVVSGTCTPSATSAAATLTVSGAPSITAQPSNVTQCAGTNATFSVTASGSGLTYQWQVNTGGGFANVASGGTSASYTVNSITAAQNNYQYQVVVSGAGCATPTTSSAATLTVNTLPAVTTQPSNQTVCAGATATFTAAATGTNIAYQWQVNTGSGFANVASGGNAASYTTAATTAGQSGYQYQVLVSGTCTPNATSSAATLTVNTLPTVTTQPAPQTVCAGASVTFTAAATGTGITYQWQENTGSGFNNISGANSASYTINPTTASQNNNQYQVVVSGTCSPSATSSSVLLTVNPLPVINITGDHETNPNQSITLNASSNPTLSTCGWLLNGSPISGSGSSSYTVNESTPGLYPYAVSVTDVNGCTSVSDTFLVRVRSLAFIYPNPTSTGQFNISYEGFPVNSKAVVTVFDAKGSKVYAAEFTASTSNYVNLLVNVRKLSRGTYMVILSDTNGKKYGTGKVVVD